MFSNVRFCTKNKQQKFWEQLVFIVFKFRVEIYFLIIIFLIKTKIFVHIWAKSTKNLSHFPKNLAEIGTFPQYASVFRETQNWSFRENCSHLGKKEQKFVKFCRKCDNSIKCLVLSPNPKLVVSRKLFTFVQQRTKICQILP
jgi:hypothetical protein